VAGATVPASSPLLFPPSAWVPLLLLVSVLLSRRLPTTTAAAHSASVPQGSTATFSHAGGVHSKDGCHNAATSSPSSCEATLLSLPGLPAGKASNPPTLSTSLLQGAAQPECGKALSESAEQTLSMAVMFDHVRPPRAQS